MKKRFLMLALAFVGAPLAGCDLPETATQGPDQVDNAKAKEVPGAATKPTAGETETIAATPAGKVAEAAIGRGVKLEIVAQPDGSFLVTQAGRYGTAPLAVPAAMLDEGDPIALFKYLAPHQDVPEALRTADQRASALLAQPGRIRTALPAVPGPKVLPSTADGSRRVLFSDDQPQSNWTGYAGCPGDYFEVNFCPPSESDDVRPSYCYLYKNWAYLENPSALGGWGAVCADQGQVTFRITAGTVTEYTVDQGSWRSGLILHKRTCGFWSCSDVRFYLRFELVNRPDGSVGHFSSDIDH
jgi:hypothetical protein